MRCDAQMHNPAFGVALLSERVGLLSELQRATDDLRYPVLLFLYTTGLDCTKINCGIGNLFRGYPCLSIGRVTTCRPRPGRLAQQQQRHLRGRLCIVGRREQSGHADRPTSPPCPAPGGHHATPARQPSARIAHVHTPQKLHLTLNTNSFPLSPHHISHRSSASEAGHRVKRGQEKLGLPGFSVVFVVLLDTTGSRGLLLLFVCLFVCFSFYFLLWVVLG